MTTASTETYGVMAEPTTLRMQRWLPGPIDRVWAYLTDSGLRRQWLAAGDMELRPGAPFELVWRNDELTRAPDPRPSDFAAEQRMQSRIIAVDPPRKLAFSWEGDSEVTLDLEARDGKVLLTVTHLRLPRGGTTLLHVNAGWHAHLDILVAKLAGEQPPSFWNRWSALKDEYESRLKAWTEGSTCHDR